MLTSGVAVAGAVTLTAKSDCVCAVVCTDEVLLVVFWSGVVEVAVAVLTIVVSQATFAFRRAVIVKLTLTPLAMLGVVQLIVPFVLAAGVVQVNPAGVVFDTKTVPAGSGSLNVTVSAVAGPRLVRLKV